MVLGGLPVKTLRQVRAERMLTTRELAARAGVSHATVHLAETGKSIPRLTVVRKLAQALEVDPLEVAELRHAIEIASQGRPGSEGEEKTAA
jgi:DNA-binding XRE family transcriptional regulator